MKRIIKIVIVVLAMMFIVSMCSSCSHNVDNGGGTDKSKTIGIKMYNQYDDYCIIELTYNGKTHEFVKYGVGHAAGLSHWPDCKFCKKDSIY